MKRATLEREVKCEVDGNVVHIPVVDAVDDDHAVGDVEVSIVVVGDVEVSIVGGEDDVDVGF